jgi:hypothetical protein
VRLTARGAGTRAAEDRCRYDATFHQAPDDVTSGPIGIVQDGCYKQ